MQKMASRSIVDAGDNGDDINKAVKDRRMGWES